MRLDLSANTIAHDRALAALIAFAQPGGMPGVAATAAGRQLSSTTYAPLQRALIGIPDGAGDLETIAQVRQHPTFASVSTQSAPLKLA